MNKKNATQVKSVSFPKTDRYMFFGYTFEIPMDCTFHHIEVVGNRVVAHTSQGEIILRHCTRCKRLLPVTEFYQHNSPCKFCHQLATKRWAKNNPEKAKKYASKCNKKYRYKKKLIAAGVE